MKRWLLYTAFAICFAASLVAMFYITENHRAAREWQETQARLAAEGVPISLQAFLPAPIPDEQNLAMAPYYQRALAYQKDPKTGRIGFGPKENRADGLAKVAQILNAAPHNVRWGVWRFGRATVFEEHSKFLEEFLTEAKPPLAELENAAASRPLTQFPVHLDDADPPHISFAHCQLITLQVRALRFRADIEARQQDGAAALRDLTLAMRLTRSLLEEPAILSQCAAINQIESSLQAVYDALAAHCWNDDALAQLQHLLDSLHPLPAMHRAMDFETVSMPVTIDFYKSRKMSPSEFDRVLFDGDQDAWLKWCYLLAPAGSFDRVKGPVANKMHYWESEKFGGGNHWIHLAKPSVPTAPTGGIIPFFRPFSWLLVNLAWSEDMHEDWALRAARAQAALEEASIACALERQRLKDGECPDTLAGEFFDPIEGAPLHYRREGDGYVLYSVGPNGRDDGGALPTRKKDGNIDDANSDWVWVMPPRPQPTN